MENEALKRQKKNKMLNKQVVRERFTKVLLLSFCVVFLAFLLYFSDESTKKMMRIQDDKYALRLQQLAGYSFRLDLAGEKYIINLSSIFQFANEVIQVVQGWITHLINR